MLRVYLSRVRWSSTPVRILGYVVGLALGLLVWLMLSAAIDNVALFPGPGLVLSAIISGIKDGSLLEASEVSLLRLLVGFTIGILIGVPLGLAMGLSQVARRLIEPIVEILRPISGIAWIPLGLLILGIGNSLIVYIIFYGAVFPIIIDTAHGCRSVNTTLVQAAHTFGLSRSSVIFRVLVPNALPMILTGIRVGMGTAWMSLVAAELVGAHSGLGFSVQYFATLIRTPSVMAYIVAIGILGLLTNILLVFVSRALVPWASVER